VVVFWLVMMTALVRVELYPHARLLPVSTTEVLDKVFHAPEPINLDVFYRDAAIGSIRVDMEPTVLISTNADQTLQHTGAYKVTGNLRLKTIVFGAPTTVTIRLASAIFDSKYAMKSYDVHTAIGESHTDIKGDNDERVVDLSYGIGAERQSRHLAYDELAGQDFFSALNMNGLPGFPAFSGGGLLGGGSSSAMAKDLLSRVDIQAYHDHLGDLPAYVVEIKMDQSLNLWAKIWVDQQGGVQQIDTSLGLQLRRSDGTVMIDHMFDRGPRRHHDPH
jgi:hypothetical protein